MVEVPWAVGFPATRWIRDMPVPALSTGPHRTRFAVRVLTLDGPKTRIYGFNTFPYRWHGHYPYHSHSHGIPTEYAHDDYGSG